MRFFVGVVFMLAFFSVVSIVAAPAAFASGECPLHGNITYAASGEGKFSLGFGYEYTYMETIREGTDSVSPDSVLDDAISSGAMSFTVPTEMVMQKYLLTAGYAPTARLKFVLTVPYVINDMDMRTQNAMGMVMDMSMDTVDGLGDATLAALYSAYSGSEGVVSFGLGVKAPTGKNDEERSDGSLIHAHMQPGSGSWDPIFLLSADRSFGKTSLWFDGSYHLATEGDEGYEFGDVVSASVTGRYQALAALRVGLGLGFLHSEEDEDHDGNYTNEASLLDNTENTGITALYLKPEARVSLGESGSLLVSYHQPIYQDANGTQQVVDWRASAMLGWSF